MIKWEQLRNAYETLHSNNMSELRTLTEQESKVDYTEIVDKGNLVLKQSIPQIFKHCDGGTLHCTLSSYESNEMKIYYYIKSKSNSKPSRLQSFAVHVYYSLYISHKIINHNLT